MQRKIVASVLVVLAGCGSGNGSGTSPTTPSSTPSVTASADTGSQLEGTWRTGPVSEADIEQTLREANLGRWIQPLRNLPANAAPVESNVFVLDIAEGRWDLYWEPNGAGAEQLDYDASYEVDGQTVTVSHEGDFNTYRWSVEGDGLTLTWLDTTYDGYKGIPEEVFQTAFYMTAEFERQA